MNEQARRVLLLEAPMLIPLYALLADAMDSLEPLADSALTFRMKRFVVAKGIRPAMWRLLCKEGTPWLTQALEYYSIDRADDHEIAIDLLRIVQAFGTRKSVPWWLLQAILQLGGNPNSPQVNFCARLGDLLPFCTRLGHLLAHSTAETIGLLQQHVLEIFGWASDHLERMPLDYCRRVSVKGLICKVEEQQVADAKQRQSQKPWKIPYRLALQASDVQAVILDSPWAVWNEGKQMRHCADKYVRQCARLDWLMVSLRSSTSSRPLATIAFEVRGMTVTQRRISGFANSLVSPLALEISRECCWQLQRQRDRLLLGETQAYLPKQINQSS
jgi:hypothetical protein